MWDFGCKLVFLIIVLLYYSNMKFVNIMGFYIVVSDCGFFFFCGWIKYLIRDFIKDKFLSVRF